MFESCCSYLCSWYWRSLYRSSLTKGFTSLVALDVPAVFGCGVDCSVLFGYCSGCGSASLIGTLAWAAGASSSLWPTRIYLVPCLLSKPIYCITSMFKGSIFGSIIRLPSRIASLKTPRFLASFVTYEPPYSAPFFLKAIFSK